jgi:hypothetical protein
MASEHPCIEVMEDPHKPEEEAPYAIRSLGIGAASLATDSAGKRLSLLGISK